jgi:hypothetical protein
MQEAVLAAAQLLGLVIAGVVLYQMGQTEVGSLVIGAALGHAAPRRRRGDGGGSGAGGALALLLAVGVALSATGCGPTALEVNGRVATALDVASAESATVIRDQRRAAMESAGRAVLDAGGDEAAMVEAVRAKGDEWQEAIDAHAIFDTSIRAYMRAAIIDAGGGASFAAVAGLVVVALSAYERVRRIVSRLSDVALPELPEWLADLVESVGGSSAPAGAEGAGAS